LVETMNEPEDVVIIDSSPPQPRRSEPYERNDVDHSAPRMSVPLFGTNKNEM